MVVQRLCVLQRGGGGPHSLDIVDVKRHLLKSVLRVCSLRGKHRDAYGLTHRYEDPRAKSG